jgi:molybdopterin synthase catalytic subunit
MAVPRFAVTAVPLDSHALARAVLDGARGELGAVVSFAGIVRGTNAGRRVLYLDYEAYEPLAVRAFERIEREAGDRWAGARLGIHHRTGHLEIGECSIIIVAASAHRAEAYQACRYAIERVKQIAPVWKHEYFAGGDVWIEGATAEPDDEAARAEALNRACV